MRISGGEGDENIAGTIARNAAVAAKAERDTARESFELLREERRVGGNDYDDGAALSFVEWSGGVCRVFGNFVSNGNTGDAQIGAAAIIALHQNTDGETPIFRFKFAR